ncbi:MAG: site-2 protease family protein [Clostridia bacterium]|nr:site-2 protease family protein [Clostridia bacterium]
MNRISEKIGVIASVFTLFSLGTSPHPFVLIFSYIIHEAGHIFFAKITGAGMKKIRFGAFRLCLSYDKSGLSYKQEMLVQAGGIIFNLLSALIVSLFHLQGDVFRFFQICNISLALMNLYPISILDGGGILKNVFLCFLSGGVAEKLSKFVSFIGAILMWLVAVYIQIVLSASMSLFVISVFLLVELCFSNV